MARKKEVTTNKLDENVFQKEYLKPLNKLRAAELKIWNEVVKSMKPDYFIESDRTLIMEYIKLKIISDGAYKQLEEYDLATAEGNRLVGIISKATGALSTTSQKLGIAPSSRVRHGAKTNPLDEEKSELDGLLD
ncbi:MAG: hypothetical protein M0R38_12045 [Bacteroidia bacterium]|nr:hypothetical protein [Bacteroidia bacterium]